MEFQEADCGHTALVPSHLPSRNEAPGVPPMPLNKYLKSAKLCSLQTHLAAAGSSSGQVIISGSSTLDCLLYTWYADCHSEQMNVIIQYESVIHSLCQIATQIIKFFPPTFPFPFQPRALSFNYFSKDLCRVKGELLNVSSVHSSASCS